MKYNNESRHTKAYTFASLTSDRTNPSLQKSMLFSDPNKIVFKKFPSLQKNKKYSTHSRHSMTRQLNNDNGCSTRQTRTPAPNSGLAKVAVQCFVGQFCGYINISASYESLCWKSPPSPSRKTLDDISLQDKSRLNWYHPFWNRWTSLQKLCS